MTAFGNTATLDAYQPERVTAEIGVKPDRIRRLARDFAGSRPSVAVGGGLVGAHTNGTEALSAVFGLNLLVGNWMAGRHLIRPAVSRPRLTLRTSNTLRDWQTLAEDLRGGQVKTLVVHRANPVHGLPAALKFGSAMQQADAILSFSSFLDDTTSLADLVLPTHLPLEDWGDDIAETTGGPPTFSMQQPVVQPLHNTRGFGDLLLAAAAEMGGALQQALPWPTYKDLLREAAGQLQHNHGGSIQSADFEQFWTTLLQHSVWTGKSGTDCAIGGRTGADHACGAAVLGRRAGVPVHPRRDCAQHARAGRGCPTCPGSRPPRSAHERRVADLGRGLNPPLAERLGLREGDVVRVESPEGQVEVPST